jgi:hypothetical protein
MAAAFVPVWATAAAAFVMAAAAAAAAAQPLTAQPSVHRACGMSACTPAVDALLSRRSRAKWLCPRLHAKTSGDFVRTPSIFAPRAISIAAIDKWFFLAA